MKNTLILSTLIMIGALSRLIPHPPNLTALTAIALLGGAYLVPRWAAVVVPLVALFITDAALGFHSSMNFVYLATALIALISLFSLRGNFSWSRLLPAALGSSLLFFFITNFGVWTMDALYPQTWQGLVQCYAMAIPFLTTQIVGDLFYSALLFGAVQMIRVWRPDWVDAK